MTNDAIVLELNDILNRIAYLRSCILDIDAAREVDSGACPAPKSIGPEMTAELSLAMFGAQKAAPYKPEAVIESEARFESYLIGRFPK